MQSIDLSGDTYISPPVRVGWFARMFPSLVFHARYVYITCICALQALRGKYDDDAWAASSMQMIRHLENVGVRFEITGLNYLRQVPGACLVVGNHMSSLETMVLPALVQPIKKVTFVVKQSLLDYPIFKHVMRSRDPVAVTTKDARQDFKLMMEGGAERLARGTSIIIFPEGRRAAEFVPEKFNSIGVKLASRAGVPIVPVALETRAWALGKPLADFGPINPARKVRFAFGPPLAVEGRGTAEQAAIIAFIQAKLDLWAAEDAASGVNAELVPANEGNS
jgi:1-acyl-sn-glycerol-3-phosphate acyltransferase